MYNSNENHNLSSYFISNKKDGRCRENRSVKSLFIYFKNCESNSFIKKLYIHGVVREERSYLEKNTQKIIFVTHCKRLSI